jgi:hypothetical protein
MNDKSSEGNLPRELFIEELEQVYGGRSECNLNTPLSNESLTTYAIGEEDGNCPPDVTTMAVGEEDGDFPSATTLMVGEEGDGPPPEW